MRERSRARSWALQVLYAWEARGGDAEPVDVLEEFRRERRIAEASQAYLQTLVSAFAEHRKAVDAALQNALTNWRMERLSAIDRNILRIAAAEMMYVPDVPPRVSIREAIRLGEKFGTAESPRFINGVLDALMHATETAGGRGSPSGGTS